MKKPNLCKMYILTAAPAADQESQDEQAENIAGKKKGFFARLFGL